MEKYLGVLKKVNLFEGIEPSDIKPLLSCLSASVAGYAKRQMIFVEGDSVDKVGIVLSGQVQVIKEDFYGNRNIVAVLNEGALFGETFVCADVRTLPVSVYAVTDCEILFVDYRRLITTCSNTCSFHQRLIFNMLRILANKNIGLTQKIEYISKRTTREKLLAYLSAESKRAKSNSITIPVNRQELADYLSVDRSAMSAELGRLRDEGILNFNKNWFELISR